MGELMKWVTAELSSLLPFPVTNDMAKCILMIESPRDLEDYMQTLLDLSNPSHQKFIRELISKKQMIPTQGYKKTELDNYIQSKTQDKKDKKKGSRTKNEKPVKEVVAEQKKEEEKENTKKRTQFRSIFNPDDRKVILLKGRNLCHCQASKHALINNCLKCGRIVCEQEGAGPCFFCSTPVYKRGEIPPKSLNSSNNDTFVETAIELRDRLLEYDRTSERRTKVVDDQSDYFSSTSVWLSKEQKEELKKKEEELMAIKHSRTRNLILDITGRRIIDDEFKKLNDELAVLQEVSDYMDKSNAPKYNDNIDPNCNDIFEPAYEEESVREKLFGTVWKNLRDINRIQDRELLEMSDKGLCLSVDQPWASLLVAGIKDHEGRNWYTDHRGCLWIAATVKPPPPELIEYLKQLYTKLDKTVKFPTKFPIGCLLGCVKLVACLPQEEYRETYATRMESNSPFVFICESPTPCPVLFPLRGKPKIYKLDSKIHQAAQKCIQKLARK